MAQSEKMTFEADPQMIMDVIKRQAGTLQKAALEGIMNSIDAGATEIHIELTREHLRICDNGRGFRGRDEIVNFFNTFGKRHTAAENKVYGAFRMGRGQLMAFGRNIWRSGNFRMVVDILQSGLDWNLDTLDEEFPGCQVHVALYQKLTNVNRHEIEDAIKLWAKYVSVPTFLNDEKINKDPATERWDHELEVADIKIRETGPLRVYNLGVMVREFHNYHLGCGGDVVTKKALKVNFARNDIMSDCPVWKEIRKILNVKSTERNVRAPRMTDDVRRRLATQVQMSTSEVDPDEAAAVEEAKEKLATLKLITDSNGRNLSYREIANKYRGRVALAPRKNDQKADMLMQHNVCTCIGPETLERFELETLDELIDFYARSGLDDWTFVDYAEKARNIGGTKRLVDKKDWKPPEKVILHVLNKMSSWLINRCPGDYVDRPQPRLITLGICKDANAWTDGSTFIAISRAFIADRGADPHAWVDYGTLLLHEYCHRESSVDTHTHDPEFYQLFHDWSREKFCLSSFVIESMAQVTQSAYSEGVRVSKQKQRDADRLERATEGGKKTAALS
jgi:hypothetical protein